jgi:hypothetical protein
MDLLQSERLWPELQRLANKARQKQAAVAFVSNDDVIAFGANDRLITDASDNAITAGQTSAVVLERAVDKGAAVYSLPRLHSKVFLFDDVAVIGSANVSAYSASELVEAAWITDSRSAVKQVKRFLDSLLGNSTCVDPDFLRHILGLQVRPRTSGALATTAATAIKDDCVLLFFKQVMEGDIKKFRAESNLAPTGGGARDLRVSPVELFQPALQQMFSQPGPELSVTQGPVAWRTKTGGVEYTTIELWPPTNARGRELRISKFYDVGGWDVSEARFAREIKAGNRCFYVLEMDRAGVVWARILWEKDLNKEQAEVVSFVRQQISDTPTRQAVRGVIDLLTGETIP